MHAGLQAQAVVDASESVRLLKLRSNTHFESFIYDVPRISRHSTALVRYGIGSQVAIEQVKLAQLHALAASSIQDERGREGHVMKSREIAREAEAVLQWFGRTYESSLLCARSLIT